MRPNPGQARFDDWASSYDRSMLQRLMFEPVHQAVLDAYGAAAGAAHDVLDVGCGTGRLLEAAARRWGDVRLAGIDASEEMIAQARAKHAGDVRFVFRRADAAALPFESNAFDAVFSTVSFHHWGDQAAGIREVMRVLRPDGLFVLADIDPPFLGLLWPLLRLAGHANMLAPAAIVELLERADLAVMARRRFWPLIRAQLFVARKRVATPRTPAPSPAPSAPAA